MSLVASELAWDWLIGVLALVRSVMTKVKDGKVVCTCEHHKASVMGGEKL